MFVTVLATVEITKIYICDIFLTAPWFWRRLGKRCSAYQIVLVFPAFGKNVGHISEILWFNRWQQHNKDKGTSSQAEPLGKTLSQLTLTVDKSIRSVSGAPCIIHVQKTGEPQSLWRWAQYSYPWKGWHWASNRRNALNSWTSSRQETLLPPSLLKPFSCFFLHCYLSSPHPGPLHNWWICLAGPKDAFCLD